MLGHYLFDQFYVKNMRAVRSCPKRAAATGARDLMGGGGYIPRFRNLKPGEKKFLRGYSFDFGSGGDARRRNTSRSTAKRCRRSWPM